MIEVPNPLGHSVTLDRIYRNCMLSVQGYVFPANMMELPFDEFDLILGMDWLSDYGAIVDCKLK